LVTFGSFVDDLSVADMMFADAMGQEKAHQGSYRMPAQD
jgi:hypothetical protein